MNKLKTIFSAKKLAIFLMAAVSVLILVACGTTSKVPYGSLSDNAYITIGNETVTEKQLYDQLRTSSLNRLNNFIDKVVFADVVLDTANLSEFEVKAFEQEINTALFSSATFTATQVSDLPDNTLAQRILSFADSFTITNPSVSKANLLAFLDEVTADVISVAEGVDFDEDEPFVFGYIDKVAYPSYTLIIDALLEQYKLPVLKKVHAKAQLGNVVGEDLDGDINDEESSAYISEAHAVTYYKNNIAGRYDTSALIVKFDSVLEYETALRKHSIKSNARGEWYRIPNISDEAYIAALNDGTANEASDQKVIDILVDDLKQDPNALKAVDYRESDFATYYSKYVINSTVDADLLLNDDPNYSEVLEVFLAIYDDLHDTNYAADFVTNNYDIAASNLVEEFTYEYTDPRFTNATALRDAVYAMDSNVLYDGGEGRDEDDNPYAKPYSRQVQSIGGSNYLLFLFADDRASDDDVLDEEDSEDIKFLDNPNAQQLKLDAYNKLIEQRLTTAYINERVEEKFEDVKINIYDPIIRELYKNSAEYTGSNGFKDNKTLLEVNGQALEVDAFFDIIEETLGLSTALDIIFINKLRETYKDEITKDDMAEFREQFETQYVNPFLAGQYESAGFPASIGIDNFLLLGFGAWAQDGRSATADAIDKVFVQTKLRELFQEDLTLHFADDTLNNNIYTKFAELANNLQDQDVAIDVSHLLFQVDLDRDGQADDPNDLDQTQLDYVEGLLVELIEKVNARAALASSKTTGLQNVVSAYNGATRYELTTVEYPGPGASQDEIDEYINGYNREDVWVKFRKAGITLMYEDLGTITNETNFPGQGGYDTDFFEYTINLANYIKDEVTKPENGEVPSKDEMTQRANALLPLVAPTTIDTNAHQVESDGKAAVRSSFGWHLIVAKSYVHQQSARLEAQSNSQQEEYTSKLDNPYIEDAKVVGFNNDSDQITWEQLYIFIEEAKEETGVVTLTNSVQTTIGKYFSPIFSETRYLSSYAQLEIAFLFIFDGNVQLTDAAQNTKLQILREANFNQFFNYAYFDGIDGTGTTLYDRAYHEAFAASYGDFFKTLHGDN